MGSCKFSIFNKDVLPIGLLNRFVAPLKCASLKQEPSLLSINFQSLRWKLALCATSLSIRVLLFMLLVVAGDVERNPGPPKKTEGLDLSWYLLYTYMYINLTINILADDKWNNVDNSELSEQICCVHM